MDWLHPELLVVVVCLPIIVWLTGYLTLPHLFSWYYGTTQYRNYPALRRSVDVEIATEGIVWRSGTDRWVCNWTDIVNFDESKDMALLYVSPRLFYLLPKSEVSNSAIAKAKACIFRAKRSGRVSAADGFRP